MSVFDVKQEFLDSPNPNNQTSISNIQHEQQEIFSQLNKQAEVLPINLANDQKSSSASHTSVIQQQSYSAVKNLTPKIMELSTNNMESSNSDSPQQQQPQLSHSEMQIKEEDNAGDYEYNYVFCKKVLKAQQTKGFLNNASPTPSVMAAAANPSQSQNNTNTTSNITNNSRNLEVPIITTTAASPPPSQQQVASGSYLMGPPAQISMNTSTSPTNLNPQQQQQLQINSMDASSSATAKVSSRNMALLRAKRLAAAQAVVAEDMGVNKDDAVLPENLGLPRERVISICNMDKHELDTYLDVGPPEDEEEDEEESNTELLQYFPTRGAEEKQNSLNAAKTTPTTNNTVTPTTNANNIRNPTALTQSDKMPSITAISTETSLASNANLNTQNVSTNQNSVGFRALPTFENNNNSSGFDSINSASVTTVGSASASLVQMSQKHQQQQLEKPIPANDLKQQQQLIQRNPQKRKINLNAVNATTDKNCIFLPISPNINGNGKAFNGKLKNVYYLAY